MATAGSNDDANDTDDGVLSEVHVSESEPVPIDENNDHDDDSARLQRQPPKRYLSRFTAQLDQPGVASANSNEGNSSSGNSNSSNSNGNGDSNNNSGADDANDVVVVRRRRRHDEVITIEHSLATPLHDVGKQVWRGALLLGDFLIHRADQLRGARVLEIGAGTGLAGIAAARVARRVYLTDFDDDVLVGCRRNVARNRHLFQCQTERYDGTDDEHDAVERPDDVVRVRKLDLLHNSRFGVPLVDAAQREHPWQHQQQQQQSQPGQRPPSQQAGRFESTDADLRDMLQCDVLLGADIIYDDELTGTAVQSRRIDLLGISARAFADALFDKLRRWLTPGKVLWLAMEKRVCFSLNENDTFEAWASAHSRFLAHVTVDFDTYPMAYADDRDAQRTLQQERNVQTMFTATRIDVTEKALPMYFEYSRSPLCELWELRIRSV